MLARFFAPDPLDAQVLCERCQSRGTRVKTTEVLHWPPVLVLSLKRFEFDARTRLHRKISRFIRYEMQLPHVAQHRYFLRAVIVHQGDRAGAGHYVAYVRDINDAWYYCNDRMTPRKVAPATVLAQQAYMLIYERSPR